ncbi:MAG TPA: 4Fe-4S dicluster domain-containing protein, partial [Urbifossiella sp.]|nr:4Fe-4S dicluster domain-containing protein [Urbifossiella sp.]
MAAELEVGGRPQVEGDPQPRGVVARVVHHLVYPFRRGKKPERQVATGFYTDTTVCIGCKACEVACKQWNQLPADGFGFTGNSYDNTGALGAESWRHVKFVEQFADVLPPKPTGRLSLDVIPDPQPNRWLMMSDVCKHCVAAPCQHACPTGAILYNEFANVYIQPDICNGCAYCIAACPFGVI